MNAASPERRGLAHGAAVALAALLIGAAYGKCSGFERFVDEVAGYAIVPAQWLRPVATMLVALEVLLAVLLLAPRTRAVAAFPTALLFLVFAAAVGASVTNGRENDCGCALPFFGESAASG